MIWSAWNNGKWLATGAGYGFRVPLRDRKQHFRRAWQSVRVQLPMKSGIVTADISIAKPSFWSASCGELIAKEIGAWLIEQGRGHWATGKPPKVTVKKVEERTFHVVDQEDTRIGA